jgi:hypothetical protein
MITDSLYRDAENLLVAVAYAEYFSVSGGQPRICDSSALMVTVLMA